MGPQGLFFKQTTMSAKNLFRVVKIKKNDEDKYIIVCGKSRASKLEFEDENMAWTYINTIPIDWDVLITVIGEMFEIFYELKNKQK